MNLQKTRLYKDTFVGKGSQLANALEESDKDAKKVYEETTKRYEQQYPADAREYFKNHMIAHKRSNGIKVFNPTAEVLGLNVSPDPGLRHPDADVDVDELVLPDQEIDIVPDQGPDEMDPDLEDDIARSHGERP